MTRFGWLVVGILIIIIAVLAWIILAPKVSTTVQDQSATTTITNPPSVPASASRIMLDNTYTNHRLSFSIMYPSIATTSPHDYSGYLPLTQAPLASFALPRSLFEGTNLTEAGVYVGASSSPEAITACGTALQNSGEKAQGTVTINGADFSVFTASDAGAGNFYDSKIYRRIENGWCVEVVELLHSGNIGNYTPGTVKEFDKAHYQNILESIVHTYRSIPTGV